MASQITHDDEDEVHIDDAYFMEIDEIIRVHVSSQNTSQHASSSQVHDASQAASLQVEQGASMPPPTQQGASMPPPTQQEASMPPPTQQGLKIRAPAPFVGNQPLPPRFQTPTQRLGPIVNEGGSKYLMLSNNEAVKGKKK
ncbi:hypothetical protein OROMI_022099 [Orobanche minor]